MKTLRNSVLLIGHLGIDPELKQTQSGVSLARITLATNEVYRNNKGDKITTTQWHTCIGWGKRAEVMNDLLKKGKKVAITGKLTYSSYEDKNGITRTQPQIVINEFVLLN